MVYDFTSVNKYKTIMEEALKVKWLKEIYFPFFNMFERLISDFKIACSNPNLLDYFLSSSIKNLDWRRLSSNSNLNISHLLQFREKEWVWESVSSNLGIKLQDILGHPELAWDWKGVSSNPNLTIDLIKEFPEKDF